MTDLEPHHHRFPVTIVQHAIRLYHRFLLSFLAGAAPMTTLGRYRDVQEVLHPRGIQVSLETRREGGIKFSALFAEGLCHRDTEAAKTFLSMLLGEYDVPEVIHTDRLRSDGAAIRALPNLVNTDHQQVISTAKCNDVIEQSHRPTRRSERQRASVFMGAVLPKTTAGVHAEETSTSISQPARQNRQPSPLHLHQRVCLSQKK